MKHLLITILILISYANVYSQTDCEELIKYRNNELFREWVVSFEKYELNHQKVEEFKKKKKEWEDASFGSGMKTIGEIAILLEATCNLAKDILGMLPAAKTISKSGKAAFFTADMIQKMLIEEKDIRTVTKDIAIGKIKSEILDELNPAFKAVDMAYSFSQKINQFNEFSEDARNHINLVKEQLNEIEESLNKYQATLDKERYVITQINEIKNAIDKYCAGNPIIKVVANMNCRISVDLEETKFAPKGTTAEFSVEKGKRFIIATSTDCDAKWDTVVDITQQEPITIHTRLKSKKITEGSFTDSRDGKRYKTVRIGNQVWLAENLNYSTGNSWCYDGRSSNCNKYGRLYDWNTARRACPSGWRLPSKSDFETLLRNVGGSGSNAYHALKDGGSSGFSALFGGWRSYSGDFRYFGSFGSWWSSSVSGTGSAWGLSMDSSYQDASIVYSYEEWGFSVRCLQD